MKNNLKSRLIGLLIVGSVSLNFNLKVFIPIVNPVSDAAAKSVQGEEATLASRLPRPSTKQSEEPSKPATPAPSRHELPVLTMKDALSATHPKITNISWLNQSSELIGSLNDITSGTERIVAWNLNSGTRRTVAEGRHAAASPDQKWLIYLDDAQWQLQRSNGASTTPLGRKMPFAPTVFIAPQWSPDSRYVAVIETLRPPTEPVRGKPEKQNGARVEDVGASPSNSGELGAPRITIYDPRDSTGRWSVPVEDEFVYYADWGKADALYFVGMRSYRTGKSTYTALKRFNLKTERVEEVYRLADGFMQGAAPQVSPDGRYVALALDVDNMKWDDYNSLVVVDTHTGIVKRLTDSNYVVGNSYTWSPDGSALYAITRNGGLDQIKRIDVHGNVTPVTNDNRAHSELAVSADGRWLAYQTTDGYGRRDLRVRATFRDEERVVEILSNPSANFSLGSFRQVKWPSVDGLQLFGYLFLPPGFNAQKQYPVLVDVHGGGTGTPLALSGSLSLNLSASPLEWHAWALLGYVVFVPDMRSSGEYGPKIAADRYAAQSWDFASMDKDAQDVESAARWLIAQGYIDPRNIAVFGHSAGAARVNLLLTRSRLFSAGIIHEPGFSGTLPFMIYSLSGGNTGRTLDERYISGGKLFAEDSTSFTGGFLFDGFKSTTPTLIMIGNPERGAVASLSAEVLFSMLRLYRLDTRMLRYLDEGHNPTSVNSALHRFEEIKEWIERHSLHERIEQGSDLRPTHGFGSRVCNDIFGLSQPYLRRQACQ